MSRRGPWIVGAAIVLVLLALGVYLAGRRREVTPLTLRPEHAAPASQRASPAGPIPPRGLPRIDPPVSSTTVAAPGHVALPAASPVKADVQDPSRYPAMPTLPPDDDVGEIRRLLGSGERAEAMRRLRALHRRHPRYELPQDLLDLHP